MMKNVYSVGQVNTYIKNMFAQDFMMQRISVKGEVSNCKYHSSGHIYFTLKDPAGTINAIMFAGNRRGLSFQMKEGDKVIVTGSVEVYERDGKYQLYAREIELDGAGNLYLKFEALKKELEEMGMFAPEYKKRIPTYIRRLGIVTAPTGAAVQDIRNISARRNPYVQLILYPALVQGEGAVSSIVNGIRALDALGHQTDTTIADFVADLRAPTPSAAAELAVFDHQAAVAEISAKTARMNRALQQKLDIAKLKVNQYQTKLQYVSPESRLHEHRRYAVDLEEKLYRQMEQVLTEKKHRLAILTGQMEGVSPLKKLSQGFSYVADETGKAVTDASTVKVGDPLTVHLLKGTLKANVTEVFDNE